MRLDKYRQNKISIPYSKWDESPHSRLRFKEGRKNKKQKKKTNHHLNTFMNRRAQPVHLGAAWVYGLGTGVDNTNPSGDSTYMSSGTILSFWTPT